MHDHRAPPDQCLAISTYFCHLTKSYISILFKTSFESSWVMPGHPGGNLYKIGPNKFIVVWEGWWGRGCLWGNSWRKFAFCLVCIFHNKKMHVYLIFINNLPTNCCTFVKFELACHIRLPIFFHSFPNNNCTLLFKSIFMKVLHHLYRLFFTPSHHKVENRWFTWN